MKNFWVLTNVGIVLALVGCSTPSRSTPLHKYTARFGFSVTVPKDPEVHGYNFQFFTAKVDATLLEVNIAPINPPYTEMSTDYNLDVYERAYKGEKGAVVEVRPIAL